MDLRCVLLREGEGKKEWESEGREWYGGKEGVRGKAKYPSLALGGWTPLIMVTKAFQNGVARPKRPRPYRTRSLANAEEPREYTLS